VDKAGRLGPSPELCCTGWGSCCRGKKGTDRHPVPDVVDPALLAVKGSFTGRELSRWKRGELLAAWNRGLSKEEE